MNINIVNGRSVNVYIQDCSWDKSAKVLNVQASRVTNGLHFPDEIIVIGRSKTVRFIHKSTRKNYIAYVPMDYVHYDLDIREILLVIDL